MSNQLQELWIEARVKALEGWVEYLLNTLRTVEVMVEPRPALVMMEARDSVEKERFCVGELLVTECQLLYHDKGFWGRVLGNQPLRAFGLALLEAAQDCVPEALDSLEGSFRKESAFIQRQRAQMGKALGATKVQFDTMTPT